MQEGGTVGAVVAAGPDTSPSALGVEEQVCGRGACVLLRCKLIGIIGCRPVAAHVPLH